MTMGHADLNLAYDSQSGPRGAEKTFVSGMVMGMARRDLGNGTLQLRAMLSPEPLMGARGYLSRRYSYAGGAVTAVPDHVISAYQKLVTRGLFNAADKGNDHER